MSNTTNTKQRDLLHTQENVENNPNSNSPLIERIDLPGTPFTLIGLNDQWFTVMGNTRLTEPTKHKDEQLKKLEDDKWLIIINCIITITRNIIQEYWKDKLYTEEEILKEEPPYETESL